MQWLGMRVRSRTARTSCCCETAATTPLVLATSTEVGSMSGVTTIDTGARSAVTAATGRNAGRTESAVQHDTNSAATAVRTRRALIVANSTVSCEKHDGEGKAKSKRRVKRTGRRRPVFRSPEVWNLNACPRRRSSSC